MEKVKSRQAFLPWILRALFIPLVLLVPALMPGAARAQSTQEPTRISIGAPARANAGESLTVQAVLVNGRGAPLSKETVYFTTQTAFLSRSSDVVLAQAVTNKDGQAVARFTYDFPGDVTLNAEFHGDSQYAPSSAAAQITAVGERQVYTEQVGVEIPGFNVPPVVGGPVASVDSSSSLQAALHRLWPAMNAWPIAAALIIVWSLFFRAVTFLFRIARPDGDAGESKLADRRRSL